MNVERVLKDFIVENVNTVDFTLKKRVRALKENRTFEISNEIIKKLFKDAAGKVKDIDFGNIPETNGDITKVDGYQKLKDSIALLKEVSQADGEVTPEVEIVESTLKNLESYKPQFQRSFEKSNDVVILLYTTTTLGLFYAVSYLISIAVEYVKDPAYDSYKTTVKKLQEKEADIVINGLKRFNDIVEKGSLDKLISTNDKIIKKQASGFTGAVTSYAVVEGLLYLGLASIIVPLIKELIYQFYYTRVKFADYCKMHIGFLEANIEYLKSTKPETVSSTRKVIERQKFVISMLDKLRVFMEIRVKQATVNTKKEIAKRNIEYKDIESDLSSIQTNNSIII